jgi:hypothetical protein
LQDSINVYHTTLYCILEDTSLQVSYVQMSGIYERVMFFVHGVHCAGLSDVNGASQYVVPRGGIFLGKLRGSFAGS